MEAVSRLRPPAGYLGRIVEAKWEYLRSVRFSPPLPPAAPAQARSLVEQLRQARAAWLEPAGGSGAAAPAAAGLRPPLPLVAEVKRRSPSAGVIARDVDPATQARRYLEGGACAVSVLADGEFFGGSPQDVAQVTRSTGAPVLFKDIVVHPCQIRLAGACGAAAVLLIVAAVTPDALAELCESARLEGLEPVVEVHDEGELDVALGVGAPIIGVNNRNLHTFEVDTSTARRLLPLVPPGRLRLAESGYRTPQAAAAALAEGADAVLVGEALMRASSPGWFLEAVAQELAGWAARGPEGSERSVGRAGAASAP